MSYASVNLSQFGWLFVGRKGGLLATTALLAALTIVPVKAFAQTWDGETNLNFLTGTNWDGNVAPSAAGAVVVDNGGLANQPTLAAGDTATVGSVAVSAGTLTVRGDLTASTGVTISGTGGLSILAAGTVTANIETTGGTTLNDNAITGNVTVAGGTFNNAGSVSGTTSVSAGTLNLNGGTDLADTGSVGVSGTGTLTVNAADTVGAVTQTGGTIDGAATLTATTFDQSGGDMAGTISASGAKTLSGGTISGTLNGAGATTIQTGTTTVTGSIAGNVTLASGTLVIGDSNAIGGSITTTGSVISYDDAVNEASAVIVNSNTTQLNVSGADAATQSGVISELGGPRPIEKIGTGTLALTGANTYTGATAVTAGTLNVSGGAALSDTARTNVATGAVLGVLASEEVGSLAGAGNVALTGTLTTGGDNSNSTYSGVASGAGGLVKEGTGTLTVTGINTYTGATDVTGGILAVTGTGALASTDLETTAGGILRTDGDALADTAIVTNAGTLSVQGTELIGAVNGAGAVAISAGQTLQLGTGASNISGVVSGNTGGLTVQGTSNTTLSGANTYTGTTTITGGTLQLSGGSAIVDTGVVTMSAGTLDVNAAETIGSLATTGGTVNLDATLTTGGNNTSTSVASVIGGAGGLTKAGTGNMTLSGANTYAGQTTVNAGTLTATNNAALGNAATGTTVDAGATLALQGGITTAEAITLNGIGAGGGGALRNISGDNFATGQVTLGSAARINSDAGTLDLTAGVTGAGQNLTLGGAGIVVISGAVTTGTGTITKDGTGAASLTGANTFTGATTINAGSLLVANGAALSDTATVTVTAPGTLRVLGSETVGNITGAGTIGIFNGQTLTAGDATASSTFSGVIQDDTLGGPGNLRKQGTGNLVLSGANTYGGLTTINAGVLTAANDTALGATSGATTVTNGAALQVQGGVSVAENITVNGTGIANDGAIRSVAGTNTLSGTITLGSAARINTDAGALTISGGIGGAAQNLTLGGAANTTVSGAIGTTTGTLTKDGAGIVTLTGANSYTGATDVTAGVMAVTGTGTLASLDIETSAGATFRTDGAALLVGAAITNAGALRFTGVESIASVNGAGTVLLDGAVSGLTLNAGASAIAGVISGTGALVVTGTDAVTFSNTTLTAANTYTGSTDVTGTGRLSVTGAGTLASVDIETAGTGAFSTDGGALAASTAITNNSTNTAALTFTGAESIASLNGSGTVFLNGAAAILTLDSGTSSVSGVISGTGGLTVGGLSTTTLSAANTYTGQTTVDGGILSVTGAVAGASSVVNAGTLNVAGGTMAGLVSSSNGTVNLSAGGALTAGLTNTGATVNVLTGSTGSAGVLTNTSGIVNVQSGATLTATTVAATGGTFNLTSGNVTGASFANGSMLNVSGSSSIANAFSNTGTINLLAAGATDVLSLTSVSAGNLGAISANLDLNAGTSDRITSAGGGITGANLTFTTAGNGVTGPITVLTGLNGGAALTSNLPLGGSVVRVLTQNGNQAQVVSLVNPAISGIASAASVTQSLIASIVNRPTSPFVSGLAAEETCSSGGYARATGGIATVTGTSTSNGTAVSNDLDSRYYGLQGGYDFGCFDGRYANGWDGAVGIMGGVNSGSTEQNVYANPLDTSSAVLGQSGSDFDQSYVGLYAAASRDKISGDLQLRFDNTKFTLNDNTGIGFNGEEFNTTTTTFGARFNYRATLNEEKGISLVPTIGFNYSHTTGDSVTFNGDGLGSDETLVLDPFNSFVGFVGATIAQTKISAEGTAATTMFASGNYYSDFGNERTASFTDEFGGINNIKLDGIGGFAEASIGINYVKVLDGGSAGAKQLNANIRADARFGEGVKDAYSLTAQVRLSF